MSNTSQPAVPDPWAQARRIAAEWQEARRDGADRPTQVARVRAARAARATRMQESRIKAAVDKAVREALARPEFGQAVDRLTEAVEAVPAAAPPAVPGKPLHEMTLEEWRVQGRTYWEGREAVPYRPLTIGELTAGRYDGDEA